jgi:hypothetical protein
LTDARSAIDHHRVLRHPSNLLPYQRNALEHIQQLASRVGSTAGEDIRAVLDRAGLHEGVYDDAIRSMRVHARVALHFHPERLSRTGRTVAEGLLQTGVYMSQFETGLSGGSPSAYPGGERDVWEDRLFGGAYHEPGASPAGRPKYGALAVMDHPDGPAPRFGSCYFLLRPNVSRRSTFTFGSSHEPHAPERTGTLEVIGPVMAPLLAQLEQGSGAFGVGDLTVAGLLDQLTRGLSKSFLDPQTRPLGRALDSFIEAQIHGDIRLGQDVERLVADPAFRDHPVGEILATISTKFEIPLSWHPGFALPAGKVPDVFRGYPVRPLAERIAAGGVLDPANIGAMANSFALDPEAWRDWASSDDTLTQFRRLWHVIVVNGAPD